MRIYVESTAGDVGMIADTIVNWVQLGKHIDTKEFFTRVVLPLGFTVGTFLILMTRLDRKKRSR